jgi:hypothetical protein
VSEAKFFTPLLKFEEEVEEECLKLPELPPVNRKHAWLVEIARVLNNGLLPSGYYALGEQVIGGAMPDALHRAEKRLRAQRPGG